VVGGQLLTITPPLGPQRSHSANDGGDEGWGQAADGPFSNAPRVEYLRSIFSHTDSMANKGLIRFSILEFGEKSFWGSESCQNRSKSSCAHTLAILFEVSISN